MVGGQYAFPERESEGVGVEKEWTFKSYDHIHYKKTDRMLKPVFLTELMMMGNGISDVSCTVPLPVLVQ